MLSGEFKHNWGTAEKLYKSEAWVIPNIWYGGKVGCCKVGLMRTELSDQKG